MRKRFQIYPYVVGLTNVESQTHQSSLSRTGEQSPNTHGINTAVLGDMNLTVDLQKRGTHLALLDFRGDHPALVVARHLCGRRASTIDAPH